MGPTEEKTTCIYTLTAEKTLPEDNGIWKCEVSNSHGVTSATCTVRVVDTNAAVEEDSQELGLPRFVETLENVVATEDKDAVFRCKTNPGDDIVDVKWYRNEIPIEGSRPGMERYYISSEEGVQQLDIRRSRPRDVGIYKCKIYNKIGWTSCDAKLYIGDPSGQMDVVRYSQVQEYSLVESIKSRKALQDRGFNDADLLLSSICDTDTMKKFLIKWQSDQDQTLSFPIHLKNKCSVEGSLTILSCLMTGKHPFEIRWYRNNMELFDGFKYYMKSLQGVLSLTIPKTETTDTGNYTCVVKNRQGKIYTSCYLQVEPAPYELTNEVPTKPMFVKPLKRVTVNEGELINFRVTAKGYPSPGFKWFKDGLEIHDSERIKTEVFPNGIAELTITNSTVRDIGLYTCEAHNMAGRAQSMVRVSVRDKFEQELYKGRDLDGIKVETEGNREINGKIESEIQNVPLYTQRIESQLFHRTPDFKMRLPSFMPIHSKQRFLLEIRCNGNPKPYVRWYKDGLELFDETRYNFLSVGDWYGLEIVSAKPRDAGTYTVKLDNDAGVVECSCKVEMQLPISRETSFQTDLENVEDLSSVITGLAAVRTELEGDSFNIAQLVPSFHLSVGVEDDSIDGAKKTVPEFTVKLSDKETTEGEDVTLECVAEGFPVPKVKWYKNDQPIKPTIGKYTITSSVEGSHSLIIASMHMSDSDCYRCEAVNECGSETSTAHIIVQESCIVGKDDGEAPCFEGPLHNVTIEAGQTATIKCVAKGTPTPTLSWSKDGVKLTSGGRVNIVSNDGTGALTISDSTLEDVGVYICIAENAFGKAESCASIKITEKNDEVDSTAGTIEGVSKNQSENQREKQLEESKDDIRESKAQKRETAAINKNKSIETSTTIEEETATMIKTESVETTSLFTDYTKRPRFVIYPSSHWSAADIPLKIEVEVTKSPDLKVNWYHNDKLVVPGDRFKLQIQDGER